MALPLFPKGPSVKEVEIFWPFRYPSPHVEILTMIYLLPYNILQH